MRLIRIYLIENIPCDEKNRNRILKLINSLKLINIQINWYPEISQYPEIDQIPEVLA